MHARASSTDDQHLSVAGSTIENIPLPRILQQLPFKLRKTKALAMSFRFKDVSGILVFPNFQKRECTAKGESLHMPSSIGARYIAVGKFTRSVGECVIFGCLDWLQPVREFSYVLVPG
jgi:hypothetical protein